VLSISAITALSYFSASSEAHVSSSSSDS